MGAIPYHTLIFVEPSLVHRSILHEHNQILHRSIAYANDQPDVWPTIEDAMRWHKVRAPWKEWGAEALQVFSVSP
jgi:hypothetical protein